MKRQFLFASYIPAILLGLTITSCSSDDDSATDSTPTVVEAAKAPDFTIYSGETTLYTTLDTRTVAAAPDVDSMATIASTEGVEVNLSLNTEKDYADFIATKLSIHIRALTNATVTIPIDAKYYVDANIYSSILAAHSDPGTVTFGNKTCSYTIDNHEVTVAVGYAESAITVTTTGITQEVLNYLNNNYGDGVTFEVWNYYNKYVSNVETTRTALKVELDKSTIAFTTTPAKYTNAFGAIYDYPGVVYGHKVFDETINNVDSIYVPFTDADWTTELSTYYYYRSTYDNRYFVLKSTKNDWDCTVTPETAASYIYDEAVTELRDKLKLENTYNVVYVYTPIYKAE